MELLPEVLIALSPDIAAKTLAGETRAREVAYCSSAFCMQNLVLQTSRFTSDVAREAVEVSISKRGFFAQSQTFTSQVYPTLHSPHLSTLRTTANMANHNQMIFLNLPVADLEASIAFYTALGFRQNTVFSSPDAAGMVLSDSIWVMLHTPSSFASFLPAGRKATDAKTHTECLFCLSRTSREAVDEMVEKAGKAGGGVDVGFKKDEGYMYGRSFEDLDGKWLLPLACIFLLDVRARVVMVSTRTRNEEAYAM